jgi:DNA-binding response OmpR family regulator
MILFVDDETRSMDSYERELSDSGYDVSFQHDIDEAVRVCDEDGDRIELVILDIMMPPGSSFKNVDTQTGLRTGLRFYEKIRQKAPELPIMILTNVLDETVAKKFNADARCQFLLKEEFLPFELVEEVRNVLTRSSE